MSQPSDDAASRTSAANDNPFVSPKTPNSVANTPQNPPASVKPYVSGSPRAGWAIILNWCGALLGLMVCVLCARLLWNLTLLSPSHALTNPTTLALLQKISFQLAIAGRAQIAFSLFGFMVALLWIHQVSTNLPALGAQGLRFRPGWAVGYYFIPLLNLFRPYQVMVEIYRASDPQLNHDAPLTWQQTPAPTLVKAWWFMHLGALISGYSTFYFARNVAQPGELTRGITIELIAQLFFVASLVLMALVIGEIDNRQTASAQRIHAAASDSLGGMSAGQAF